MSNHSHENDSPLAALKSDAARQRWELFHRAIAHAKRSTIDAPDDAEDASVQSGSGGPMLTIVR